MPEKFCRFQRDYDPCSGRFYCAISDWQNDTPLCSYKSRLPRKGCGIANCEGVRVKEFLEGMLVPSNPASALFAISFDTGMGLRIDLAPILPPRAISSLGARSPVEELIFEAKLLGVYLDVINTAAKDRLLNQGLRRP